MDGKSSDLSGGPHQLLLSSVEFGAGNSLTASRCFRIAHNCNSLVELRMSTLACYREMTRRSQQLDRAHPQATATGNPSGPSSAIRAGEQP